jgi:hypothetical protein
MGFGGWEGLEEVGARASARRPMRIDSFTKSVDFRRSEVHGFA